MNIQTTLEQLKKNNVEHIEELYFSYKDKTYNAICKYPNGRIYIQDDALNKNSSLSGPFSSMKEAQEKMDIYYTKIWENPDGESFAGDLDLTYITNFYLAHSVNDFESARNYLIEDDMTQYAKGDFSIPKSGRDKIENIIWQLNNENSGVIIVRVNDYLTEDESKAISEWISGQCSDGLGEGFETQEFANYNPYMEEYNPYYAEEEYEEDYNDWVMCSFDWQTNDYALILQK